MKNKKNIVCRFANVHKDVAISSLFIVLEKNNESLLRPRYSQVIEKGVNKITLTAFEALDTIEQSILFSILSLAAKKQYDVNKGYIEENVDNDMSDKLLEKLVISKDNSYGCEYSSILLKTTFYQMLKESSMSTSSKSKERLKTGLSRISRCSISLTRKSKNGNEEQGEDRFISYHFDEDNNIYIAVNPDFVQYFKRDFTKIDIEERRQIGNKSQIALLVHTYLQAKVSVNADNYRIRADTLARAVYGDELHKDPCVLKNRRKRISDAIQQVSRLEKWEVSKTGTGSNLIFKVNRAG